MATAVYQLACVFGDLPTAGMSKSSVVPRGVPAQR